MKIVEEDDRPFPRSEPGGCLLIQRPWKDSVLIRKENGLRLKVSSDGEEAVLVRILDWGKLFDGHSQRRSRFMGQRRISTAVKQKYVKARPNPT
jgi:hypothetical protein